MSVSNRSYVCVVCGEMRRAPLPPGLMPRLSTQERARREVLHGEVGPEDSRPPVPYGHWRNWVVAASGELPAWLYHCGEPMFLLGKRAAQAATQIDAAKRLAWIALGCRVMEHATGKRWRPILKASQLKDAFPLI